MDGMGKAATKRFQRAMVGPFAGRVIGKIRIFGPISSAATSGSHFGSIGPDRISQKIKWAVDRGVRCLIFEINSPGGAVLPSKEIADAIRAAGAPTVAWVRDVAASGAYWAASACDRIVADHMSSVGSIGVISTHLEFSELMKKFGVGYEGFKSGEFKDMGVPFRKISEKERRAIKEHIDKIHDRFVASVAENRGLEKKQVEKLADGRIFLGDEAKSLGLVDRLGGRAEAIRQCEIIGNFKHIMVADIEDFREELLVAMRGFLSSAPKSVGRGAAESVIDWMRSHSGFEAR